MLLSRCYDTICTYGFNASNESLWHNIPMKKCTLKLGNIHPCRLFFLTWMWIYSFAFSLLSVHSWKVFSTVRISKPFYKEFSYTIVLKYFEGLKGIVLRNWADIIYKNLLHFYHAALHLFLSNKHSLRVGLDCDHVLGS